MLGVDGITRNLSAFRGHPVFLYLWTAKSPDCEQELTALDRVYPSWRVRGNQLIAVNDQAQDAGKVHALVRGRPLSFRMLIASDDTAAAYNILYRHLFDRHRDLHLPTALLLNENGEIVKIYQGVLDLNRVHDDFSRIPRSEAERIARALPFPANSKAFTFGRNYLSLGSTYFQRGYIEEAGDSFRCGAPEMTLERGGTLRIGQRLSTTIQEG